jgi:hypothetical protein
MGFTLGCGWNRKKMDVTNSLNHGEQIFGY